MAGEMDTGTMRNHGPTPRASKTSRRGLYGHVSLLRRIGLYLWIGLVDPPPPRLPRSRPLDEE